jgi:hypothetical protein
MTATDEQLDRLEDSVEALHQELERLLDEIYPPRPERPLLRLIVNEEASDDA